MSKIALIYGTRFGSTEEIAQRIRGIIEQKGVEVEYLNAKDKKSVDQVFWDLEPYDGILLGSGIQIAKWTKDMLGLLKRHGRALSIYKKPLGLFVSCGTAGDKSKTEKARDDFVEKIAEEYTITPTMSIAFGGIFDFSKNSRHGKIKGKLLLKIAEKEENKNPGTYNLSGINDMRDWARVEAFTGEFLEKL